MSTIKIVKEDCQGGVASFEVEGTLDSHNFERLESIFEKHFANDVFRFVITVSKLEYVSSAGAGVFIGSLGTCQDNHGNLVLVQPSSMVRQTFELLGVLQLFPIVQSQKLGEDFFRREVPITTETR